MRRPPSFARKGGPPCGLAGPYGDQASRESASRKLPCVTAFARPVACRVGSVATGRMKRSKLPLTSIRNEIALPSESLTDSETITDCSSSADSHGYDRGSQLL